MTTTTVLSYEHVPAKGGADAYDKIQLSDVTLVAGDTVTYLGDTLTVVSAVGMWAELDEVFSNSPAVGDAIDTSAVVAPPAATAVAKKYTQLNDATSHVDLVAETATVSGQANFQSGADMGGSKVTNVAAGTEPADAVNYGQLSAEIDRATSAEADLQSQINNVLSNLDPAALDSLTEVVAVFKNMDDDLAASIATLSTGSSSALATEKSRAEAAESDLSSSIDTERSRALAAEGVLAGNLTSSIFTVSSSVDTERAARIAGDAAQALALSSAVSTLNGVDSGLQNQINALTTDASGSVADERAARIFADNQLALSASAYDGRALTAESVLSGRIDTEASRATGAENALLVSLNTEIDARISGSAAEITRATDAEAALLASLNTEIDARISGSNTLTTNLASEASTARSAEAALGVRVTDEVTARETAISNEASARASNVADLNTAISGAISAAALAKTAEANRAIAAEGVLTDALAFEVTRSTTAEGVLAVDIFNESTARAAAITSVFGALSGSSETLQSNIDTVDAKVVAILSASNADYDTFAEVVALINSVDVTNDAAFAGYIVTASAAQTAFSSSVAFDVNTLRSDLGTETARAIAYETVLSTSVDTERSRALAAEGGLAAATVAEKLRAEAVESDLSSSVDTERSRALAAEAAIVATATADHSFFVAAIDTEYSRSLAAEGVLSGSVNSEQIRALAAEAGISSDLATAIVTINSGSAAETAARIASDNTLTTNLSTEVARATAAEGTLTAAVSANYTALSSSVDTERARALSAESTLQTAINGEATSRGNADNALGQRVDNEITARTNADNALGIRVDNEITARTTAITDVYTALSGSEEGLVADINLVASDLVDFMNADGAGSAFGGNLGVSGSLTVSGSATFGSSVKVGPFGLELVPAAATFSTSGLTAGQLDGWLVSTEDLSGISGMFCANIQILAIGQVDASIGMSAEYRVSGKASGGVITVMQVAETDGVQYGSSPLVVDIMTDGTLRVNTDSHAYYWFAKRTNFMVLSTAGAVAR
jgi:hypothetical protein